MLDVTESKAKRSGVSRRPGEGFLIVTNTAGRHLAAGVRLTVRSMAAVTTVVCVQANRNGQRRAAQEWFVVTSVAAIARARSAGHMLRMIKLNIEAFIEPRRKTSQRRVRTLNIRMTNLAHRNGRSYELAQVTVGAGFVAGKFWCGRIVAAAFMA